MAEDRSVLRVISWRDICPWLLVFRSLGISISGPLLLLATIGVITTHVGWLAGAAMFDIDVPPMLDPVVANSDVVSQIQNGQIWSLLTGFPAAVGAHLCWPFRTLFDVQQLASGNLNLRSVAMLLFGGLWSILVWAFVGGAISRIAVVQLATGQRIGLREACGYAKGKLWAYFSAPLMPLLGILVLSLPIMVLGLFLRAEISAMLVGVVWPLALVAGFLMALLAVGTMFGWPLMWATISSEDSDAFDALSRAFAYSFQRPLHYLFYAIVACLLGSLSWNFVSYFAYLVVSLTSWGAAWGAGSSETLLTSGTGLMNFWNNGVRVVATGFGYSFFWTATGAIYLLLRRDVDQKQLDEVFLTEETDGAAQDSVAADTSETEADGSEPKSS